MPRYLNFGAIGAVIGHEITHGFDDRGRLYDADGNSDQIEIKISKQLRNIIKRCSSVGNLNDWWEKATGEEYVRRAKCIVDQYSARYNEQTGLNLKGKQNQGENIADNGGIKEAYMAYCKNSTFTCFI